MEAPLEISPSLQMREITAEQPHALVFKTSPELLHLCEMDSLMPTMSRREEMVQAPSIHFEDELLLQAGVNRSTIANPPLRDAPSATPPRQGPISVPGHEPLLPSLSQKSAWGISLTFPPSVSPTSDSSHQKNEENLVSNLSSSETWPSLLEGNNQILIDRKLMWLPKEKCCQQHAIP